LLKWSTTTSSGRALARCRLMVPSRPSNRHWVVVAASPVSLPKMCAARQRPGSQYVAIRYTERLLEAGIEPSVGSVGDSYDNALAETINGLFKIEAIRFRWYNNRHLFEPIGNMPLAEAKARYYAQLEAPP